MEWETDWGLRARMALTLLLLGVLYVLFVGALSLYVRGILPILLVMGAFMGAQFLFSDKLTLRSMGATEVDESEHPDLYRSIRRLSQQADLPMPTVAVADSTVPNAFAAGRSRKSATVCVTTGLLSALDEDELDGVLAHELAHVKNRDVAVMTIVSFLLIRALSRYREFAADRGGALITGNPAALASALATIDGRMDRVPTEDLRDQAEMNAFFVIPIERGFVGRIARTHPSTERRIERLQALDRELAGV